MWVVLIWQNGRKAKLSIVNLVAGLIVSSRIADIVENVLYNWFLLGPNEKGITI